MAPLLKSFDNTFSRFDTTSECDVQTVGQTDGTELIQHCRALHSFAWRRVLIKQYRYVFNIIVVSSYLIL